MLTMDEARGIAAGIWTRTNHKRKIMDPQLCEDIADVLVNEISKLEKPELDNETAKSQVEHDLKQAQLEVANLKTELDTLKLNPPVPKDEVV